MNNHDNYPIIISERMIETSTSAQRIYIERSSSHQETTVIRERMEKYESMYAEMYREMDRYKRLYT